MKKTISTQFMGVVLCILCIATGLQAQNLHTECRGECYVSPDYTTELSLKLPFAKEETTITADIRDGMAYYQGDIMLGELSNILQKGVGRTNGLWPNSTIPYTISSDFSADEISKINNAAAAISNGTNLRVIPRTTEEYYVNFVTSTGCSSYVGMIGEPQQPIWLASSCSYGSTIHEILHAAGIYHEQSRSDRDNFVIINFNNIQPDKINNFEIAAIGNPTDYGPYDYESIMHYHEYAFAIKNPDGTPVGTTITTIPEDISIGQRDGLSAGDIATVNAMYQPANDCSEGIAGNGDVNLDGTLNIIDALLIAKYDAGLMVAVDCGSPPQLGEVCLAQADMNCDGLVNIIDALLVAQCDAGIINPNGDYCPD